ncbi:cytochrome P450 2K6-like isoform X2 [Hyperolius riggenbachi]|uniref:cytochrome P450 2K6-like isoform X2 n=1 Tax=Hyperolius riggenbachi TaxID=752182 RepID=UPI0035A3485D
MHHFRPQHYGGRREHQEARMAKRSTPDKASRPSHATYPPTNRGQREGGRQEPRVIGVRGNHAPRSPRQPNAQMESDRADASTGERQELASPPLDITEDMFPVDPVTVLVSIIVILLLAIVYNKQKQEKGKNLPPGPRPLPIIGNIHLMDMRKPYNTFIELSKKYGPIFTIHLGTLRMVVLCGYDAVKEALVNQADEFVDRPKMMLFYKVYKNHGVAFSNGENWKEMRTFAVSVLRDYGMGKTAIEDTIIGEAGCLLKTIRSYGGKPFNNQVILNAAVANIIASMLLNQRFDYDDPTLLKLMNLVNENARLMGEPMAQEKPESTLCYHDDNLIALIAQLFAAGIETVYTTLRWGLLLMIKYPEIQKKVQNEIDRVIGTTPPKMEHKKQMPYTDAVLCEVQRFGDIAPNNFPHSTCHDVTLRGYFIPKGTTIIPLLSSVLRDKVYFAKPYEFYPEHFLDEDGHFKNNEAFIPFSAGKRNCAGETLARMELFLFFTALLQNFTFQAPPGAVVDLTPALSSTNSPLPHKVCAIPRN